MDSLNGFIHNTVPHSQYVLVGVRFFYIGKEATGTSQQSIERFHIVRPLHSLQIWDIATSETAPVAFTKQRSGRDFLPMWNCQYPTSVNGAFQIAGHKGINGFVFQLQSQLLSLLNAYFVEFALHLSLHDVARIVKRLTMSY